MTDYRKADCPYCGGACEADWVDVGVGEVQCGPFYCEDCGASQIGAFDKDRELSDRERETGWYAPGSPLGSSVNAVDGVPVDHATARGLYRLERRFGVELLDSRPVRS